MIADIPVIPVTWEIAEEWKREGNLPPEYKEKINHHEDVEARFHHRQNNSGIFNQERNEYKHLSNWAFYMRFYNMNKGFTVVPRRTRSWGIFYFSLISPLSCITSDMYENGMTDFAV